MRTGYDSDSGVLTLTFDDLDEIEPFVEAMRGQNGFLVAVPESLPRGASPIFRIQKMTPPEKVRLALEANRIERQILLRETSPQVMMALLANPHVESDDVLQMVKSPYAPVSILKRVASDRRWSSSLDVRLAAVRNPQTPTVLAKNLLPGLPTSALKALARGAEAREDLKKAALELYLQRMGK